MRSHQITIDEIRELVVDNFAGGGGASTGIALAIGRSVDIAINHDPMAIAMHKANHPETKHLCESVWDVDPRKVTQGQPVGLAWFSPDCKHFSKAKGGKPVEKKIRGLAWVAVRWAAQVHPRVIMLENVEEFTTWGPLLENGLPDPDRKGHTFHAFVNKLKRFGYHVEWRELRACDYGAPTIRKRLFLVARRDDRPIVWPTPTHGDPQSASVKSGKLKPWRTAAEIIDWSLPCPSIFDRKKPLAENTMRRIARGIQKFVIDNPHPFIIKVNHHGADFRGQPVGQPVQTITAKNGWGVVSPTLIQTGYGEREGQAPRSLDIHKPLGTVVAGGQKHAVVAAYLDRQFTRSVGHPADEPLGTVTAGGSGKSNLVTAFLAQYHSETAGHDARGQTLDRPILTVDTSNRYGLVTSNLIKLRGTCADGQPVTEPVPTITAGGLHVGEVRAFLQRYINPEVAHGRVECDSSDDCPRNSGDTPDRRDMETGQDYRQRTPSEDHSQASGMHVEERISRNCGLVERQAVPVSGASSRVVDPGGRNPERVGLEPQGRQQEEQRSGEPGSSDPEREPEARREHRTEGLRQSSASALRGGDCPPEGRNELFTDCQESGRIADNGVQSSHRETVAFVTKYYGSADNGQTLDEPLHTVTTKHRFGLVTVAGEDYQIVDIGMRMLEPHELFAAQGFPQDYIIDRDCDGKRYSKTDQVARCGNAVPPPFVEALVRANLPELHRQFVATIRFEVADSEFRPDGNALVPLTEEEHIA